MEFKPYSNLAQLPYSHFASLSVAPQSFVQVLFPYLMGADWLRYHAVPYFGAEQLAVAAMYMGVLPLMLAVAALWLWRTSRAVRFAATAVVVSSLLSFGGYTPLGRVLFHIPVYNFFRDHRVHLIFLAFSVAMLAALFAGNLPRLAERTRQRLAWAIPLGFLALAAIMLIKIRAILGSMNPTIAPLDGLWIVRLHQGMRFSNPDMIIAVVTLLVRDVFSGAGRAARTAAALRWRRSRWSASICGGSVEPISRTSRPVNPPRWKRRRTGPRRKRQEAKPSASVARPRACRSSGPT